MDFKVLFDLPLLLFLSFLARNNEERSCDKVGARALGAREAAEEPSATIYGIGLND